MTNIIIYIIIVIISLSIVVAVLLKPTKGNAPKALDVIGEDVATTLQKAMTLNVIDEGVVETMQKIVDNEIFSIGMTNGATLKNLSFHCRIYGEVCGGVIVLKHNNGEYRYYSLVQFYPREDISLPSAEMNSFEGEAKVLANFILKTVLEKEEIITSIPNFTAVDNEEFITDIQEINVGWYGSRWEGDFTRGGVLIDNKGVVIERNFGSL